METLILLFDSSVPRLKSITILNNLQAFGAMVGDNENLLAVIDALNPEHYIMEQVTVLFSYNRARLWININWKRIDGSDEESARMSKSSSINVDEILYCLYYNKKWQYEGHAKCLVNVGACNTNSH